MAKQQKVEWHSIEHIPLPGGAVYVLYPTDELDPNQNPIRLFLSPIQLIYLVLSYVHLLHDGSFIILIQRSRLLENLDKLEGHSVERIPLPRNA